MAKGRKPDLTTSGLEAERREREQAVTDERNRMVQQEETADARGRSSGDGDGDGEEVEFGDTVLTSRGLPDMRFKGNRDQFLFNTSLTVNGRPDSRKLENRPDIQEYRQKTRQAKANLIFTDDGMLKPQARKAHAPVEEPKKETNDELTTA